MLEVRTQESERSCICVLEVPRQESERSCICVLEIPSQKSERSCICLLEVPSQESERLCICVLEAIKLFQCFHIQMVVVPFLRNNPSAVMFFQRFIFPAKRFRGKIFGAHLGFSLQVIHS